MEANIDEKLLLSKKVDVTNTTPINEQILRIAIYDEFKAYEAYSKIIEKFGNINPFVNIKEAEANHYSALMDLMEKYNVPVPINDWYDKIQVPNTYVEACELGVAGEIDNIAMYEDLLKHAKEEDIKNVLYRLQAASYNNHLPAFRSCVQQYYNSSDESLNLNKDDLMERLGEYQGILDDIMKGNIDENSISQIFSKLNFSMLSGALLGSASIALFNNYINKTKE